MDATTSKHMNKTKSICINGCKPFHNTKRHKFYTFYLKNAPHQCFLKCAYLHICYSNHAYLHGHCSFVFYFFNNFFSHFSNHIFSLLRQPSLPSSPNSLPSLSPLYKSSIPNKSSKSSNKSYRSRS